MQALFHYSERRGTSATCAWRDADVGAAQINICLQGEAAKQTREQPAAVREQRLSLGLVLHNASKDPRRLL